MSEHSTDTAPVHGKLYALPDATRVFVGHDYQPKGRELKWETTIGASKKNNPQLKGDTSKEAFVEMREARDATLAAPRLLYPSVQVNIDAGKLPAPWTLFTMPRYRRLRSRSWKISS